MWGGAAFLRRPEVSAALGALRGAARTAPGRSFAEHLVDLAGLADGEGAIPTERSEHVDALVRLGREYLDAEAGPGSVDGFVTYLAAALRDDTLGDAADAVELLSFHRAKGLEFRTVFVTGLERGLVPISYADTPATRAEERRLLYVACSRAEQFLHCSWARSRALGLRTVRRAPSPWLAPIEAALDPSTTAAGAGADRRAGLARARARLGDSAAGAGRDEALLVALKTWRRNRARAAGVPAYVIFPDTTLRAVAETRPATRDVLADVPGIGPVKLERHGTEVLELVRAHAS